LNREISDNSDKVGKTSESVQQRGAKRTRYAAELMTKVDADFLDYFKTACDLVFGQNGSLKNNTWRSVSSFIIKIKLKSGRTSTFLNLKAAPAQSGLLIFAFSIILASYAGLFWLINLFLNAAFGTELTQFAGFILLFGITIVLLWKNYKKYIRYIDGGFDRLVAVLKNFPNQDNLNRDEYINAVLESLPNSSRGPGLFNNYRSFSLDWQMRPGMDPGNRRDIENIIFDISEKYYGFRSDRYLYRSGNESPYDINFIPRSTETILEFRSRTKYPLLLVILAFATLLTFSVYAFGYGHVIEAGAGGGTNRVVLLGISLLFLFSVTLGFGVQLVRKIIHRLVINKTAPVIVSKLKSYKLRTFDDDAAFEMKERE